jgi:Zn finger protein HypA/HybF involved in hydrogenase expression
MGRSPLISQTAAVQCFRCGHTLSRKRKNCTCPCHSRRLARRARTVINEQAAAVTKQRDLYPGFTLLNPRRE